MTTSNIRVLVLKSSRERNAEVADLLVEIDIGLLVNGRSQCALRENGSIDLIVVDAHQRSLSEIDVCTRLREKFTEPLLLMTFEQGEEYQIRAYEAGVDECIVKPIGLQLLHAKVRSWSRWC